jgi:hypothetical protein
MVTNNYNHNTRILYINSLSLIVSLGHGRELGTDWARTGHGHMHGLGSGSGEAHNTDRLGTSEHGTGGLDTDWAWA